MQTGNRLNITFTGAVLSVATAGALLPLRCDAGPLKVLSAGACERFVAVMASEFEKRTGQPVSIQEDTVGRLVQRVNQAEPFDIVVLTPAGLERIPGRLTTGSRVELARVGIGVAVRENAPQPDIASVEAFQQTLRQARSIAYVDPAAGGTSGIYFSHLLDSLGMGDSVRAKAVLVPGGAVAQSVATGEAEIGIQMISELVGVKGVALVGPLPPPIQMYTVYVGVIGASTSDPAAARALLDLLASPEAAGPLKKAGLERPPVR